MYLIDDFITEEIQWDLIPHYPRLFLECFITIACLGKPDWVLQVNVINISTKFFKFFITFACRPFVLITPPEIKMKVLYFFRVIIAVYVNYLIIALKLSPVEIKPCFRTPMGRVKLCLVRYFFSVVKPEFFIGTWPQGYFSIPFSLHTIPLLDNTNYFTVI